jgi:hypothetical protein
MNLESLIPKHKSDVATAKAAVVAGYPAVDPILSELLTWLQDYNWPVAPVLAPFLASIGSPLISPIDSVFASNDEIWKYWCVVCLIGESDLLFANYEGEMNRIANQPTKSERQQELDEVAREAIQKRTA